MKKLRIIIVSVAAALALNACSQNSSMAEDLNSASDSVVRFVNGTFSAQIDNSDVKSVYDATILALGNNSDYKTVSKDAKDNIAEISGQVESSQQQFSVKIVRDNYDIVNIYIKIGTFGDKESSVILLSDIRTNLGL